MQQPYDDQNPWGQPPPDETGSAGPTGRAATVLWIIAGLQLLASVCCCGAWTVMLVLPQHMLDQAAQQQNMPPQMIADMRRFAPVVIAVVVCLGILPAIAYAVLGFGVRAGKTAAATTASLIAMTQSIVIGIMLLVALVEGVRQANPAQVTFHVLIFGSMLALLVYAIRLLMAVRRGPMDELSRDPWGHDRR
jgi:hypothetical protein